MQFLVEVENVDDSIKAPCRPPQWLRLGFYERRSEELDAHTEDDTTLGQLIQRLVYGRRAPCEACGREGSAHVLCLNHGAARLRVTLADLADQNDVFDNSTALHDPPAPSSTRPRLVTWSTCSRCHAQTSPSLLSVATQLYSWAKFTELVLYNASFVPELCEHVRADPSELIRTFLVGATVVNIAVESISYAQIPLPSTSS